MDTNVQEIWKQVKGYEERYLVSNLGNIKSLTKKVTLYHGRSYMTKEKVIKPRINPSGYLVVALFNGKNENRYEVSLHRVVATAFHDNPENKEQINHKDGNKLNNNMSNLEWVTRQENMKHAGEAKLMRSGERHFNFGKRGIVTTGHKKVVNTVTGDIMCVKNAAKESGYSATHMSSMLKGLRTNKTDFIYYG